MKSALLLFFCAALTVPGAGIGAGETYAAPTTPCPAGKALYDSGRFAAAEAAYTEALKEPGTEACAKAGLKEIDASTNECASAAALEAAGKETEAQAAYVKALEARPGSECAKQGLEDPDESFWEDPKGTAEDVVAWLGLLLAALGVVAIALSLLVLAMAYLPVVRNWWPASRVRAVRVSIPAFEDSADPSRGGALAALVHSKIESFGSGGGDMKMVSSQSAVEETIWNKFGAISEQAKSFGAFVGLIIAFYPQRRFEATGTLQPDSGIGPGLTLSFHKNQEISAAVTLWPEEFGLEAGDDSDAAKADRLQKLGVPAAAWISHVSATAADKTPGGANDPLSWALYKTGNEWELDGDTKKAVSLYKAAIERDKSNWGALAQLGKLEDEAHEYEKAIGHLRAALEILER
jgi:tetratricopeptide (TPR) repeat protein